MAGSVLRAPGDHYSVLLQVRSMEEWDSNDHVNVDVAITQVYGADSTTEYLALVHLIWAPLGHRPSMIGADARDQRAFGPLLTDLDSG